VTRPIAMALHPANMPLKKKKKKKKKSAEQAYFVNTRIRSALDKIHTRPQMPTTEAARAHVATCTPESVPLRDQPNTSNTAAVKKRKRKQINVDINEKINKTSFVAAANNGSRSPACKSQKPLANNKHTRGIKSLFGLSFNAKRCVSVCAPNSRLLSVQSNLKAAWSN
jgi:hypothetical protein